MKHTPLLWISGKTIDEKPVISGLYRYYETYGIPLDLIVDLLLQNGLVPNWRDTLSEMLKAGMNERNALNMLRDIMVDANMPSEIVTRLPKLVQQIRA